MRPPTGCATCSTRIRRILQAMSIGFQMDRDAQGEFPVLTEYSIVYAGMDKDALARNELELITRSFTSDRSEDMSDTDETRDDAQDDTQDEVEDRPDADDPVVTPSDIGERTAELLTRASAQGEVDAAVARVMSGERSSDVVTRAQAQGMVDAAISRQHLIERTADFRVNDFDVANASRREILLNALNGAVKDATRRSDDYLEGRLDEIIDQRVRSRDAVRAAALADPDAAPYVAQGRHRDIQAIRRLAWPFRLLTPARPT